MTTVRYWAAARAAAGTSSDDVAAATLAAALADVRGRHDARFAEVLQVCAFVVDGQPVGSREHAQVPLEGVELVDVLPPFAGADRGRPRPGRVRRPDGTALARWRRDLAALGRPGRRAPGGPRRAAVRGGLRAAGRLVRSTGRPGGRPKDGPAGPGSGSRSADDAAVPGLGPTSGAAVPAPAPAADLPAPEPAAEGVLQPAADGSPEPAPDGGRVPRRQPLLVQGAGPAVLALLLALAAQLGALPFAAALLAVQVVLVLAVLALVDAPASGGAFVVALAAVLAADAVVLHDDGEVRGLAGVVALSFIAALLHQLTRRARSRVTESMADTLVVVVLAVATACLLALRELDGGVQVLQVALVAAGISLLLARVGDRLAARPVLAVGATRGWPGLLLGLGAGVAAAVLVGGGGPPITGTQAALLGLLSAATVAAADLAVDLGAAELRESRRDARRASALTPAALLVPFALLGPIALVAGELVLA